MDNLLACIQLVNDFINSTGAFAAGKSQRKAVFSNLLIDSSNRYADIALFKEQIEEAIYYYK